MSGTQRFTLSSIQRLCCIALSIAMSLIVLQACQSRKMPNVDAQGATGAGVALQIPIAMRIIKATTSECEIRGGEYIGPAKKMPNDIVDCLLPGELRRLRIGDGRQTETRIVGNVYDYLYEPGKEKSGCGLYSYVLIPVNTPRAERLLDVIFATMSFVERSGLACDNVNVLYLPAKAESLDILLPFTREKNKLNQAVMFADEFYDYELARQLLGQVCLEPPNALREVCAKDLSRGPYLFTYSTPVSMVSPVPPPFLIVDLSNVHQRAFGEFIAAYKEQIKRTDFSDREKIDTFRLSILSIVLTAADWVGPIRGAVADTLHLTLGSDHD